VTVSMDPVDAGTSTTRGREVPRSNPTSPTANRISGVTGKQRTLSVDRQEPRERERRQSQTSAKSNGSASGQKKPSLKDFILGEELGRGSYSTVSYHRTFPLASKAEKSGQVVQASAVSSSTSPTSPGPPRQYAIKIINQAHLVQEKKVKYAMIERDALVRLNDIRKVSSPTTRGHTRGMSSSSSGGASSSTTLGSSVPLSPTLKTDLAGRRPSRSADPPEMVPERSEEAGGDTFPEASLSKAPSPVKEDFFGERLDPSTPTLADSVGSIGERPRGKEAGQSSKKPRRHSLAPSERSNKSTKASPVAHPGIIRLYSTFNDATSLYFVLDLAINGELLGFVRKFGSLDLVSARYYAAQLIDTLEFMHERGVIHRDLKPENILLDDEIRIKITDFGSAKLLDKDGGSSGKSPLHA